MWGGISGDFRFGIRMLSRNRGFTVAAAFSLGLGIGANTAVFSIFNALLFVPIPAVEDPSRLVSVWQCSVEQPHSPHKISYPDYLDFAGATDVFSSLAAYNSQTLAIGKPGEASARIQGEIVTGNYFSVLGVKPLQGRLFVPEETEESVPVTMISERLWKRRFGADPRMIGSDIYLNGFPFRVLGILPDAFRGVRLDLVAEAWVPMWAHAQIVPQLSAPLTKRGTRWLFTVGRMQPGISMAQARLVMDALSRRLEEAHPEHNRGKTALVLEANTTQLVPGLRRGVFWIGSLLMIIVGLVLLIACSNVASLLLARCAGRQEEFGIRFSLGAGRFHLFRQLLIESLLLSAMGGAVGLILALWTKNWVRNLEIPFGLFARLEPVLDLRVFIFLFLVSLLTGMVFGAGPAFYAARHNVIDYLKGGMAFRDAGRGQGRLQNAFVVSQVTVAVLLLIGAGLFLRSLQRSYAVDTGFDARDVLLMSVEADKKGYSESQMIALYRRLLERLSVLPGVESVSLASSVPLVTGFDETTATPEGLEGRGFQVSDSSVSPEYFSTMRSQIMLGRGFTPSDGESARPVAILNQRASRLFWPGENPIGKRVRLGGATSPFVEIVGVIDDWKYDHVWEAPRAAVFLPIFQKPRSRFAVHIRAARPKLLVRPALQEITALDRGLPVFDIQTFPDRLDVALAQQRLISWFAGGFGLLGLLLASVGILGLIAYSISQRTKEIGIRMALGAKPARVLRLFLGKGLVLAGLGVGLGVTLSIALTRFLQALLPGISPTDPVTFASVSVLALTISALAAFIPARRATRIAPATALRYQ